jgi:glycosyltransferase involved in cell wall biosynthesis
MMAIVELLPRAEFRLTICSLRDGGFSETAPLLEKLGVECFVARFRPTGRSLRAIRDSWRDQAPIDKRGPFVIQHSLDFTSSPFEAVMARMRSRVYIFSQRNLNQNGHARLLKLKTLLSTRIIAISKAVQCFLLDSGVPARKVNKIELGIGTTNVLTERRRGYFLCVGQIEPLKRQEDAIRALRRIVDEFPEARLGIAGNVFDQEYMRSLRQLARALGVQDRVEFLGPRKDVLELLAQSNGLIHCSESEAFGWVIVEAMSVGTPVVAAASDGPREIIDHDRTGILVECGDITGYAAALRNLISDAGFASTLSVNGRQDVARRFSVVTMVDRIRSVYLDCLGENSSSPALSSAASRSL